MDQPTFSPRLVSHPRSAVARSRDRRLVQWQINFDTKSLNAFDIDILLPCKSDVQVKSIVRAEKCNDSEYSYAKH